ncbi:MAG: hypothetical protein LUF35_13090 [Lachnospiraceae bacterium]|nr:hypothetical protein [Lachnospiraceae bacterium]
MRNRYTIPTREILENSYFENALRAFHGVIQTIAWEGSDLLIGGVCVGTGVGDCKRPVSTNE